MDIEKLKDAIWTTRISRVNAEKRLLSKDRFIQVINIYYSCVTILFSILSLINGDDKLSLITVFMTISLLITILYLNSLKYEERARNYRSNYTALHKLELELDNDEITPKRIAEIKNEYCDLLDSSSNHTTFDYCCTVKGANVAYKEKRWEALRKQYWFTLVWHLAVKVVIIALPVGIYFLAGVI